MPLLEQAIKLNPHDANAHGTLATLYAAEREKEKSLSNLQTALALTPNDSDTLQDAADTYELLGERRQAIQYLQLALKYDLKQSALKADPYIQNVLQDPAFRYVSKS